MTSNGVAPFRAESGNCVSSDRALSQRGVGGRMFEPAAPRGPIASRQRQRHEMRPRIARFEPTRPVRAKSEAAVIGEIAPTFGVASLRDLGVLPPGDGIDFSRPLGRRRLRILDAASSTLEAHRCPLSRSSFDAYVQCFRPPIKPFTPRTLAQRRNLPVCRCFAAPPTASSAVSVSSRGSEISARIFRCDGSALAYCLSIHLSQNRLICSEFGIPHCPTREASPCAVT